MTKPVFAPVGIKNKGYKNTIREIGPFIDLGMRFAISIVMGAIGGLWLDSKLHTTPFLLIAGFLIGSVAGFWTIYRAVYLKNRGKHRNGQEK